MKIYSEHSLTWVFIIALLSFLVAYFQYYYKTKSSVFSEKTKKILTILRFFILFLTGILLLDFYSKFLKKEYIKPVIVIAADNSQSLISAKDSADVKKFFKEKFPEIKKILQKKFDVQTISFGEKIHFNPDSISFTEYKTNAENIFYEPQQVLGNKPISGMIIISDGIFNEGIHPVSLTDNIQFPVYILATGDTTIYKDIAVKKVLHNKNVFIGNDFITEVLIHIADVKNDKIKISISENNKEIASKEVIVNAEQQNLISVSFQLTAENGGNHTYKVTASPVKDERNIQNNTAYFVVNVIENKTKVLFIYSAPHPDISAIRQVLSTSGQYETESFLETAFNKNINDYDVVVYHSPDVNSPLYNKFIKAGVPMMIITSNLLSLQNKFINVKQFIPQQNNEIECSINNSFGVFSITDEYKELQQHLQVILAPYGDYIPMGEYDVLYYQKINNVFTDLPLFYFTQTTSGKYAIFLGDGLWRWKMTNYQIKQNTEWFTHLITQTIRYLSVKRDKNPFKVHIPATINENEPLNIRAEFLNETMQSITEPDVFITLKDSSNHEYKYVFNKSSSSYFLNAGILSPGEYKYKAYTQYKGKEYSQSGKLYIVPLSVEKNNLVAQHQLLKIIAQKTLGQFYLLKQSDKLTEDILKNEDIKTIITQNESFQYWIDNKLWFFVILTIAISEWIIRRWNSVI